MGEDKGKIKSKDKDVGINEGIIRQRVRVIVDVIAALAEGRLAMTEGGNWLVIQGTVFRTTSETGIYAVTFWSGYRGRLY